MSCAVYVGRSALETRVDLALKRRGLFLGHANAQGRYSVAVSPSAVPFRTDIDLVGLARELGVINPHERVVGLEVIP